MTTTLTQNWLTTPPAVTALTVTGLATLANNANSSASATISTAGYLDVLLMSKLTSNAAGVSATGYVDLFALFSLDNVNFNDAQNMVQLGTLQMVAVATTYIGHHSVAKWLGFLPPYIQFIWNNQSGAALNGATIDYNLLDYVLN